MWRCKNLEIEKGHRFRIDKKTTELLKDEDSNLYLAVVFLELARKQLGLPASCLGRHYMLGKESSYYPRGRSVLIGERP